MNLSEVLIGAVFGSAWFYFLGWNVLWIAPVCAALWSLGGTYHKAFRRVGCAIVGGLIVGVTLGPQWPWGLVTAACLYGALSVGYGIPTTSPYDPGSWLGARVYELCNEHEEDSDFMVRFIIGTMVAGCFAPISEASMRGSLMGAAVLMAGFPLANCLGRNR